MVRRPVGIRQITCSNRAVSQDWTLFRLWLDTNSGVWFHYAAAVSVDRRVLGQAEYSKELVILFMIIQVSRSAEDYCILDGAACRWTALCSGLVEQVRRSLSTDIWRAASGSFYRSVTLPLSPAGVRLPVVSLSYPVIRWNNLLLVSTTCSSGGSYMIYPKYGYTESYRYWGSRYRNFWYVEWRRKWKLDVDTFGISLHIQVSHYPMMTIIFTNHHYVQLSDSVFGITERSLLPLVGSSTREIGKITHLLLKLWL